MIPFGHMQYIGFGRYVSQRDDVHAIVAWLRRPAVKSLVERAYAEDERANGWRNHD
jgi:hypothetical protein